MKKIVGYGLLSALLSISPLAAGGIAETTIDGNVVSATVSLPGGVEADLSLTFEQVVGLTASNLGLSAELISPTDLVLLSRLPSGASIPAGFPALIHVEPPASGGLSFSGIVTLSIHTHNLSFTAGCPLRLFAAPAGGSFEDITGGMGTGSYRARGARGEFSEFLLGIEARTVGTVIATKFDRLEDRLAQHELAITPSVYDELEALLGDARDAYAHNDLREAIRLVERFGDRVKHHSGSAIPYVWRSARDLDNVAGILRATAETLRFSLQLKGSPPL